MIFLIKLTLLLAIILFLGEKNCRHYQYCLLHIVETELHALTALPAIWQFIILYIHIGIYTRMLVYNIIYSYGVYR